MTDILKMADAAGAITYTTPPMRMVTGRSMTFAQLQRFADLIRADYRASLLGASVGAVGWVRTAKEGPGVYDPMFLSGKSVPTGYVSGYIPLYTAEALAARVAQAQVEQREKDAVKCDVIAAAGRP